MSKPRNFMAAAALALACALPVSADETPNAETVVATVNGTDITLGHLVMIYAGLPEQYRQLPNDTLFQGILDQLVQQTVLLQAGDYEDRQRVKLALENERRSILAAEAINEVSDAAITEESVAADYAENYADAGGATEWNASHILVATEDEAKAIQEELAGGADFAEMAKEKSTGPSGPNGGQLGWFGAGMMVPPFQAAVEALEKGQVSDPVQTQFGWHVVTLNDIRETPPPSLDDVRGEIEERLRQQAVESRLAELSEGATIIRLSPDQIDTSLMQKIELVEN